MKKCHNYVKNGAKTVSFFSVLIEKPTFVTSKCLWNQYFELTRQFTDVNKGAESKSLTSRVIKKELYEKQ